MGKQTGVSKKILRAGYHRLGAFLHAPLNSGKYDFIKLHRSVSKAIVVVESYRDDQIMNNLAMRYSFMCVCGRQITRNANALDRKPMVVCPDVKCGAMFKYEKSDDGSLTFKLVEEVFRCTECKTNNYFGAHLLADGVEICCIECSKRWRFRSAYIVEPADPPDSGQTDMPSLSVV